MDKIQTLEEIEYLSKIIKSAEDIFSQLTPGSFDKEKVIAAHILSKYIPNREAAVRALLVEALNGITLTCQPWNEVGDIEWWIEVNTDGLMGSVKIGHGAIVMRAFNAWKRKRDAALEAEKGE